MKFSDMKISSMKSNRHISYYLHAIFLFLPSHVFASEEMTKVQQAINTPASLNSDPMNSSYLLQLVIGLLIVLLCIIALAWLAKKMNRFQSLTDSSLKVIGGLSMGSRERIVLLQVGEEQLLLGVSPGRINTLHVLDAPIDMVSNKPDSPMSNGFLDKFKTMMTDADKASIKTHNKQ
jgi:flagellar protein FliO/FliZ